MLERAAGNDKSVQDSAGIERVLPRAGPGYWSPAMDVHDSFHDIHWKMIVENCKSSLPQVVGMRTLDETDLEILRLLVEDARRPYSDIAERVDVSAPTVSDRIDRLEELGVIDGFTVDLDRTTFTDGVEVLIDVELRAATDDRLADRFAAVDQIEHVFATADARLLAVGTIPTDQVRAVLSKGIDLELVESYRVHLVDEHNWTPTIGSAELTLTCDECSNTVTTEGVSLRLDGDLYHFCCPTCRSSFEDQYTSLTESA